LPGCGQLTKVVDRPPRILDDPIAPALFGEAAGHLAERGPELTSDGALALWAQVLLRSRFAEDQPVAVMTRGVRQYGILGAGFDTFGYRQQPSWARTLRIVEVDQPASQQDKRRWLADAGIVPPGNLTFAAVHFEAESLVDELAGKGVDVSILTFFSWLGGTSLTHSRQ
jgi:methyltransferase (TIGR00027 family)